jgi:hypothetical protein
MPYLEGPNRALWVPIRNRIAKEAQTLRAQKTKIARRMTSTSKNFTATVMLRLLIRSAKVPAEIENRRKGIMKEAPMVAIMELVAAVPHVSMAMKAMAPFKILSFSAPRNWVIFKNEKEERRRREERCIRNP